MSKNLKIRIGDVSISIEGDAQMSDWEIVPAYRPFIWPGETDISLRLHQGVPGDLAGEKVFDCPPIWTLYRHDGTSVKRFLTNYLASREPLSCQVILRKPTFTLPTDLAYILTLIMAPLWNS